MTLVSFNILLMGEKASNNLASFYFPAPICPDTSLVYQKSLICYKLSETRTLFITKRYMQMKFCCFKTMEGSMSSYILLVFIILSVKTLPKTHHFHEPNVACCLSCNLVNVFSFHYNFVLKNKQTKTQCSVFDCVIFIAVVF